MNKEKNNENIKKPESLDVLYIYIYIYTHTGNLSQKEKRAGLDSALKVMGKKESQSLYIS